MGPRWPHTPAALLIALALTLLLALTASAAAEQGATAQTLWVAGNYRAAYEAAAQEDTAAAQLLAARAATDLVIYGQPAGSGDEERAWLERAVEAAQRAQALAPTAAAPVVAEVRAKGELARRSGILQNLSSASELRRLFERALALEPEDADALVGFAMWHLEVSLRGVGWLYGAKQDAVLPLLERGVAAAPNQINLRVEYATALNALGETGAALEQLERALVLKPETAVDRAEAARAKALKESLAP